MTPMPSERDKASENPYEASRHESHQTQRRWHRRSHAPQGRKSKRRLLVKLAVGSGVATLVFGSITAAALITMPSDFAFAHDFVVFSCGPVGLLTAALTLAMSVLAIEDKI